MAINYNIKDVLLFLSFSMGCFLTLSKLWIWFRQRQSKGRASRRTTVVLCVGFAFVIMFTILYKNWLYGAGFASWPTDAVSYVVASFFAGGFVFFIAGIGISIQDHMPIRKNINPVAFSVTGLGLMILAAHLYSRLIQIYS